MLFVMLVPFVLSAFTPLFKNSGKKWLHGYAFFVSLITSALVFKLILDSSQADTIQLFSISDKLVISLKIDGMSKVFMLTLAVLWPLASLYSSYYMENDDKQPLFFLFFNLCYSIGLGVSMAANLISLYIFYELLTFATLPLVMHGGKSKSIKAGLKYMYYSLAGTALAFIGLMYILLFSNGNMDFVLGGIFDIESIKNLPQLQFAYLLFFLGFGVKSAVFPMHAWLPSASVAPTPVTALFHAVAVVKAGVFAIARVSLFIFGANILKDSFAQYVALFTACFTIIFGSVMALKDRDIKRRLAYSTISNLSYIIVGILLLSESGYYAAMFQFMFHALTKIALFFAAGAYLLQGVKYVSQLRGIGKKTPVTSAVFLFGSVVISSFPPLMGFQSKLALSMAAVETNALFAIIAISSLLISTVFTFMYLVVPALSLFFGKSKVDLDLKDGDLRLVLPLVLLSFLTLYLSFNPALIQNLLSVFLGGKL